MLNIQFSMAELQNRCVDQGVSASVQLHSQMQSMHCLKSVFGILSQALQDMQNYATGIQGTTAYPTCRGASSPHCIFM